MTKKRKRKRRSARMVDTLVRFPDEPLREYRELAYERDQSLAAFVRDACRYYRQRLRRLER